ncbi:MAG TPA: hypothetical protein VNA30_02155 [Mycobacteriales bacterium]|nr:hypothetical protein [Mycobacteriales bacterium]
MPDIALATAAAFGLADEDVLLVDALACLGLTAESCVWDDPTVDWASYRMCVIRSTWDYFPKLPQFLAWTKRVSGTTTLHNDAELVAWNCDKRYLAELAAQGIPTIETEYVEAGASGTLGAVLGERGWERAVVKPAVDGGAKHLFTVDGPPTPEQEAAFVQLVTAGVVLVQPFLDTVVGNGELSVFLFDGQLSHAVRKRPAPGDFRVQPEWGASSELVAPEAADLAAVDAVVSTLAEPPLYARVDLIRDGGEHLLMELEVIEPRLFLDVAPGSADRFAAAIAARL